LGKLLTFRITIGDIFFSEIAHGHDREIDTIDKIAMAPVGENAFAAKWTLGLKCIFAAKGILAVR
jgi:hypothetical protein